MAFQDEINAGQRGESAQNCRSIGAILEIDARERAKRSVMSNIGIGDGENDKSTPGAEPCVERLLKEEDAWTSFGVGVSIHTMISGNNDRCAAAVEVRQVFIDHAIESVCLS